MVFLITQLVSIFADVEESDTTWADMATGDQIIRIDFDMIDASFHQTVFDAEGIFFTIAMRDIDGLILVDDLF